jgi:ABC-type glycerol-3-phosphate transport system substrate-binding protein
MRRLVAVAALLLVAAMATAGCGSKSQPSGPLQTLVIDITISGSSTTPNGQTIDVAVGQRIELDVTADTPGEIHVHSSPDEQEFEYDQGSSTLQVKPIEAPGRIMVESHTLNKTLFILQAK